MFSTLFFPGWTPSSFVSSRQNRADKSVLGPEDFMDEEVGAQNLSLPVSRRDAGGWL